MKLPKAQARRPQYRVEMEALVNDFVRRMNSRGNPGADWRGPKQGLFGPKLCGWGLTYEAGERYRGMPVTTDGRMPSFHGDRLDVYVRPVDSEFVPSAAALKELAESMAEVLRRHS